MKIELSKEPVDRYRPISPREDQDLDFSLVIPKSDHLVSESEAQNSWADRKCEQFTSDYLEEVCECSLEHKRRAWWG